MPVQRALQAFGLDDKDWGVWMANVKKNHEWHYVKLGV